MVKEKTGVIVGGVFLSIGVNIFVGIGVSLLLLGLTIFNLDYYKSIITNDKVINVLYDGISEEAGTMDSFFETAKSSAFQGIDTSDLEFEDVVTKEFVKVYVSDIFDYAIYRDIDNINEDYYMEYFEDEMIPAIEDATDAKLSKKERKEAAKEIYKELEKSFSKTYGDSSETDAESIKNFFIAKSSLVVSGIVTMVIGIALAVVEVVIYKNKFRALRNVSIAMVVMGIFNLITALISKYSIIAAFMTSLKQQSYQDDSIEIVTKAINAIVSSAFDSVIYVFLGISVVSVAGLVVFAILASKNKAKSIEE